MNGMKCTQCGAGDLEPGFVGDSAEGSPRYAHWISGPLQLGPLGGARKIGRPRWQIDAYRCRQCAHLELFASQRA